MAGSNEWWNELGRTARRVPSATLDLGQDVVEGGLKFGIDAGQRLGRIPSDIFGAGYDIGANVVGPRAGSLARGLLFDLPAATQEIDPVQARIAAFRADQDAGVAKQIAQSAGGATSNVVAPPSTTVPSSSPNSNPWNRFPSRGDGTLDYIDRHGASGEPEYAGLRARSARPAPDFQMDPTMPSSTDRFRFETNPLFSLSQAGIAQDEAARGERAARYGGMRQEAIEEQQQNAQLDDPLGLDLRRKMAGIEMEKVYGINRDKIGLEASTREAVRRDYLAQTDQIEQGAAAALARVNAMPDSPAKAAEMERLQAVKDREIAKLNAAFGISERINSAGLLGKGDAGGF